MNPYRGYVPTKQKRCLIPFKGKSEKELLTLEQVSGLPEYAAILNDDIILVDVDIPEQAEILIRLVTELDLKCKVMKTSRGAHFLFRNDGRVDGNKTGTKIGIGLTADIKLGSRNSYHIVKFGSVERPVIRDCDEYQVIPRFLCPVRTKIDLMELGEGDGRNHALFSYILPLQSSGFSREEAQECVSLINRFVFRTPLSEKELRTVTRESAFSKPSFFNSKGTFLFDQFSQYLKNNENIICLDKTLHIYRDGIYKPGTEYIESKMIEHIPGLSMSKRREVNAYLQLIVRGRLERADPHCIAFNNGVYNVMDDTMSPLTPDLIITNKINYDYRPDAYHELMDKTLWKVACGDASVRALLEELIGACFYASNTLAGGKAFVLIGDKSNGKSTFLQCLQTLLGRENTSALDLQELGVRFKTPELFGKLANIGDDIGDEFIANTSVFKKLVTGNRVNVERKNADPFDFDNYSKLIFSANDMPKMKDRTGAVQRRLVIIPFDARFSPKDPDYDPHITYKLCQPDALEYLIKIGIDGLKRVIERNGYTSCDKVKVALAEYEANNNPIIRFLDDLEDFEIDGKPTKDIYSKYVSFCVAENLQPLSNTEFSKQVKQRRNFVILERKIKGVKYRLFAKM